LSSDWSNRSRVVYKALSTVEERNVVAASRILLQGASQSSVAESRLINDTLGLGVLNIPYARHSRRQIGTGDDNLSGSFTKSKPSNFSLWLNICISTSQIVANCRFTIY
jgi:hypothetical protein